MTRKARGTKPEKPSDDFPLSAHACGQWVKRIHGKLHYFGPWDGPEEAREEYLRRLPEITGEKPQQVDGVTIRELGNRFLTTKKLLVENRELAVRTWNDYERVVKRLVSHFGPGRSIENLGGSDFERLRSSLPKNWSRVTVDDFIIRVRTVVNYAYAEELVDRPIRTGSAFRKTSQKRKRIDRASSPKKFFDAQQIRELVEASNPRLAAMILCGVNLGYGNADCGRLSLAKLDLDSGWVAEPREKTGILRIGKLWPETIEALRNVISKRQKSQDPAHQDLVFLTSNGTPFWTDGGEDNVGQDFGRLKRKVILKPIQEALISEGSSHEAAVNEAQSRWKGVGFYALRHVTQTIGEEAGDEAAVRVLMGHIDASISERYREKFDRDRVAKVCEHLRNWYLS